MSSERAREEAEAKKQEEALVRVYRAELAILQRRRQQSSNDEEDEDQYDVSSSSSSAFSVACSSSGGEEDVGGGDDESVKKDGDATTQKSAVAQKDSHVHQDASKDDEPNADSPQPQDQLEASSTTVLPDVVLNTMMIEKESSMLFSLTQSLGGFAFLSVDQTFPTTATSATAAQQQQQHYVMEGYFVANPKVQARIHMTIQQMETSIHETTHNRKRPKTSASRHHGKVVQLDCQLSSKDKDEADDDDIVDWSYLQQFSSASTTNHSLPDWTRRVASYLKFEQKRHTYLQHWENVHKCTWSRQNEDTENSSRRRTGTSSRILIVPRCSSSSSSNRKMPSFIWEWNWKQEGDNLQFVWTNNNSTREKNSSSLLSEDKEEDPPTPEGFQDLLSCAKSCEKALELILETLD